MDTSATPVPSQPLAQQLPTPVDSGQHHRHLDAAELLGGMERRGLLDHRERQIDSVRRMSGALFSRFKVDELVPQILEVAIAALNAEVGSVQLYDPNTDELVFRYVRDPHSGGLLRGHRIPASQGISGQVFRHGEPILTNQAAERPDFNRDVDDLTGFRTRSMLTAPIKHLEGQPLGVIQVLNSRKEFDQFDLEVLEILCSFAATSLEIARLADAARKAELVNLMGDISHDIKNMLTPIQSGIMTMQAMMEHQWAELLAQSSVEWKPVVARHIEKSRDETAWILNNALSSCEQIQARTRQIANAVKGESTQPQFALVDVNDLIRQVVAALKVVTEASGITLLVEMQDNLPLLRADRRQLYNALYNLVNNAIPETPPGGRIVVTSALAPEEANSITLIVADTGRGMTEAVLASLFTEEAISTKVGGTGLGTRIVANVVRQHNGTIDVSSDPTGTTFHMLFPL